MKRVHLIISGDVQGVFYRAWTKAAAQKLNLTGWVKNRVDGAVELVAEGDEAKLQKLISLCRRGPDLAVVKNIDIKWEAETNEFVIFEVVY